MLKCVDFYPHFLDLDEADSYFRQLNALTFTNQLRSPEGQLVTIPRMMAYYGAVAHDYPYAKLILPGQDWHAHPVLLELAQRLSSYVGVEFNSVLCNLYRDGNDKIGWHPDREDQLGPRPTIASLNFGARREFWFRNQTDKQNKHAYQLAHGSLLVMRDECQDEWAHSIPRDQRIKEPRINLTFRKVDHGA